MLQNIDLDSLFQKYQNTRKRADQAYDIMQAAHDELKKARQDLNHCSKIKEYNDMRYYTIWDAYHRIRDNNHSRIDALRHEAKYASEDRRLAIEDEIHDLIAENKAASLEAKKRAPKTVKHNYYHTEYVYKKAVDRYQVAKSKYQRLENLCDRYKADYDYAKELYLKGQPH